MNDSYAKTRDRLETYFDETASKAWQVLTTDLPVSGIRARVRAGRDKMRETLLDSLPDDLSGTRVLDAGCGTGQISIELAQRGAEVLGVDISASLISVAKRRTPSYLSKKIDYLVGDMLAPEHGSFDYVLAMDSLIHYDLHDVADALDRLVPRIHKQISFTIAPQTFLLSALLLVGKAFPKSDRSPVISPIKYERLRDEISIKKNLKNIKMAQLEVVKSSFYISEAVIAKP
ncbi:MAG: magnesium protoporphyrin IX methyltransferase [Pseudomonadota bacterium]|nr:magnesium protoporphyrin IX methyltransferase [Pseudomonadota bacterium]